MGPSRRQSVRPAERAALAILVALALALFGARMAIPGQPVRAAPDLSAYAMPDGTLPTLCLDAGGGHDDGGFAGGHCPLCVIAKAVAAPPAQALPVRVSLARPADPPVLSAWRVAASGPRAPPARGPPTSLPI